MKPAFVAISLVAAFSATAVFAKPIEKTKYKYYNISGDSPSAVYAAMIRRGPEVNGVNAFASTSAMASQSGKLIQSKSCNINDYAYRVNFVINLPKLRNEAALGGQLKRDWSKFSAFLKRHEETHRSIWLDCARVLERRIKSITAKDCKSVDRQAEKMWKTAQASCAKQHKAFDAAEQVRLMQQPFIRHVLLQRQRSTVGLKIPKKKK